MFISVIPFFGPVFFAFIDAPPVLSLDEQQKPFSKGTEIHPDFSPLITSIRRFFGK